MVEPFISYRADDGKVVNDLSADAVVKSVVMASGLGADTSWTWLKLPAVDDMERVVRATSLPILLLGDRQCPLPQSHVSTSSLVRAICVPVSNIR